jgi:aminopeptidase N
MAWWNDLWLNESFATFMEKKTLDELYPEFKRGIETITSDTASAFSQDALLSTHPINVTINTPAEAGAIFDEISYAKGLAVLSMIEDYATAETFRMGLHKYFKKHLYSNADQNDLWNALREVGKGAARDLPTVSRFWVNNPGYPIVSVSRKGKREIKLEQSRFTYLPFNGKQKPWPIPIRYFDGKNEGFLLMKGRTATIKTTGSFIKLNHGQKGFYRVMYDEASLKSLGKMISSRKLSDVDAYGVISDLFARARACRIKVEDVLDFIEGYCMECGYPSNAAISSYLSGLQLRFQGKRGISARARALAIRVNRSMLKRVGWVPKADEQSEVTLQRSSAIRNSGICGDKSVTSKCISLFDSHVAKRSILHVDIRTSVYLALAFGGDAKLFQRFVNMYKLQDSGEETMRLGAAIGSFNNASLAAKALEFAMSRYVRAQDKNSIAAYVSSTPDGKGVFWRWFEENWKAIREIYKGDVAGLGRFVEDLDDTDTTAAMERIKLFFKRKENHPEEIAKSLRDTLEAIETNIRFLEHNS